MSISGLLHEGYLFTAWQEGIPGENFPQKSFHIFPFISVNTNLPRVCHPPMSRGMIGEEVDTLEMGDRVKEMGEMRGNGRGWEWSKRSNWRVEMWT